MTSSLIARHPGESRGLQTSEIRQGTGGSGFRRNDEKRGPFTGWHMAAILVSFFAVVTGVNVTMALFATGTFGGTVVDNSYVASQQFNGWLKQARTQEELGWSEVFKVDGDRRLSITLARNNGEALGGAAVKAILRHPLGRTPDIAVSFTEPRPGLYRATAPLPTGRWMAHFILTQAGREKRLIKELQ